jgi:hypothetical protein
MSIKAGGFLGRRAFLRPALAVGAIAVSFNVVAASDEPNLLKAVLDQFLAEDAASPSGAKMDVTAYIEPSYAVLPPGETQQFNVFRVRPGDKAPAKVSSVKWSLDGAGKIDRKGLYTAPIDPKERLSSVTVRASFALDGSPLEVTGRVAFPLVTEGAP